MGDRQSFDGQFFDGQSADLDRFDPHLFGIWRETPVYGDPAVGGTLPDEVGALFLETKSAPEPAEALRLLLNEMTGEMQAQFVTFREMRRSADIVLDGDDETAQKLARADVKAATDAMSLIVRTLEKIDALQRQLARDRREEAEQTADQGGYEEAKARLLQLIRVKANEQARALFEAWKRDGKGDGDAQGPGDFAGDSAEDCAGSSASGSTAARGAAGTGPPSDAA